MSKNENFFLNFNFWFRNETSECVMLLKDSVKNVLFYQRKRRKLFYEIFDFAKILFRNVNSVHCKKKRKK